MISNFIFCAFRSKQFSVYFHDPAFTSSFISDTALKSFLHLKHNVINITYINFLNKLRKKNQSLSN